MLFTSFLCVIFPIIIQKADKDGIMSYRIDLGAWGGIFAVPVSVVDKHIKLASEAQIKALLYILRYSESGVTDSQLSRELNISPEEAANAVEFWVERGLIRKTDADYAPAGERVDNADPPAKTPEQTAPEKPRTKPSRAQRPDPAFVSKLLREDACLAGLLEEAQSALKKPLSPGDTATLVMLYNSFGLPCEVIALMINYLASVGSANMRSIERMGVRWSDEGINTAEAAEAETVRLRDSQKAWGRVSSLLGIRNIGNPTKSQQEHAYRWLVTWSFSDEMITEAYERCVNTKGEYNIRYINAILQKWYEKDIKSLDSLKEYEASSKKPKTKKQASKKGSVFSVEGASFDVSKFETDSLFD